MSQHLNKKIKFHHFTNLTELCVHERNDMIETSREKEDEEKQKMLEDESKHFTVTSLRYDGEKMTFGEI